MEDHSETFWGLLLKIPREATSATIQGIKMQIIDMETHDALCKANPDHFSYLLKNGIFLLVRKEGKIQAFYKVKDSPTDEMLWNYCNKQV